MHDLAFLLLGLAGFAVCLGYVTLCNRLGGTGRDA
jgi:hypothetical protein